MIKKCYIVGAGDNSGTNFTKKENEYVIAADGGYDILKQLKISPDIVVGDFDSLGYVPSGGNVMQYQAEKDDTDMMLSIKLAIEKGYNSIEIFGGTGGRIDHTIANFQAMLYASKRNVSVKMIDFKHVYYVITEQKITLQKKPHGIFSAFAIGGEAYNVNIKGGKYVAQMLNLTPDNPMAVSNAYIGKDVTISVEKGNILIISDR